MGLRALRTVFLYDLGPKNKQNRSPGGRARFPLGRTLLEESLASAYYQLNK